MAETLDWAKYLKHLKGEDEVEELDELEERLYNLYKLGILHGSINERNRIVALLGEQADARPYKDFTPNEIIDMILKENNE